MKKWLMFALAPCLVASASAQDQDLVKAAETRQCVEKTSLILPFPPPPTPEPLQVTIILCVDKTNPNEVIRIQCNVGKECSRPEHVLSTSPAEHMAKRTRHLAYLAKQK